MNRQTTVHCTVGDHKVIFTIYRGPLAKFAELEQLLVLYARCYSSWPSYQTTHERKTRAALIALGRVTLVVGRIEGVGHQSSQHMFGILSPTVPSFDEYSCRTNFFTRLLARTGIDKLWRRSVRRPQMSGLLAELVAPLAPELSAKLGAKFISHLGVHGPWRRKGMASELLRLLACEAGRSGALFREPSELCWTRPRSGDESPDVSGVPQSTIGRRIAGVSFVDSGSVPRDDSRTEVNRFLLIQVK